MSTSRSSCRSLARRNGDGGVGHEDAVSTRERAGFRDNIIGIAATKISAGVDVGIGGHSGEEKGDEQFEISDGRSVDEVYNAICEHGLQPVMADYLYV